VKAARYAELNRDRQRPHLVPDDVPQSVTVRCRVGRSRSFSLIDRIKFLLVGRVYVSLVNAKAHTQVILSLGRPVEQGGVSITPEAEESSVVS
jgi:hypothetical protein